MNTVSLIGRLTKDPELSYTQNSTARCVFTLAVDRPGTDGEADFIRVVTWKRQAETVGRYLRKGSQCGVQGSIRTGSYKNRDGQTVYTTDVWANRVEFLGGRERHEEPEPEYSHPTDRFDDIPSSFAATDDDIPF